MRCSVALVAVIALIPSAAAVRGSSDDLSELEDQAIVEFQDEDLNGDGMVSLEEHKQHFQEEALKHHAHAVQIHKHVQEHGSEAEDEGADAAQEKAEQSGWGNRDYCPSVDSIDFNRMAGKGDLATKVMFVKLLHGEGMTSSGKKEDPYARFVVEGKEGATKYVNKDVSPSWNFGCWFHVSGNANLKISFWDKDSFSGDDKIGYAVNRNGFELTENTLHKECGTNNWNGECKLLLPVVNYQGERTAGGTGSVTLGLKFIDLQTKNPDSELTVLSKL